MNSEKKYYKLKLCYSYEKNKKCDKGNYCTYAHGKEELKSYKKECINGLACFKKDCQFSHPKDWNYINNVKTCEYYMNGFCKNGDNCDFKHIKEDIKINTDEKNNKIDENICKNLYINNNNDFPSLNENTDFNKKNIVEEGLKEIVNNIKNDEIQNKELDSNFEIFINGNKYTDNILNIMDENIKNTEVIEHVEDTNSNIIKENNGRSLDDIDNINKNKDLVIELEENFEEYIKKIKNNIDKVFTGNKYIYGVNMKFELNKIMSEINLFKNNYQDIIEKNKDNICSL